jgi:hypothetical protein
MGLGGELKRLRLVGAWRQIWYEPLQQRQWGQQQHMMGVTRLGELVATAMVADVTRCIFVTSFAVSEGRVYWCVCCHAAKKSIYLVVK